MPSIQLLTETPSQTAGPYVHIGLASQQAGFEVYEKAIGNVLVRPQAKGERIRIEGHFYDGSGTPMYDALLEIWQANAAGRYAHPADAQEGELDPHFLGYGRAGADFKTGIYTFETIKPGPVMGRKGRMMAPHINFWLIARGINIGLHTRMYFSDEADANGTDPVLNSIEWMNRRNTLVAQRKEKDGQVVYEFDIHVQGPLETVFFDM